MTGCPSVEALEGGGDEVLAHLPGCALCRSIVELLRMGAGPAPGDCARAELLIAAGAASPLAADDASFLPEHLARCPACREAALEPPAGDEIGLPRVQPGNYQIGAEIGRGGMGRVLSARDRRIGRAVALKEMLVGEGGAGPAGVARARFEREARITARLQHPGIVSIYEVGRWPDGRPFYAMPILPGRTLHAAIAEAGGGDGDGERVRARLRLVPAVIAAADAVAYAHSRRIIHRDLTPANILLGSYGETIVIDWGVAKELDDPDEDAHDEADAVDGTRARGPSARGGSGVPLTVVGAVVGTPAYIAPEQAAGGGLDERADVYALGAILCEVLTGRPPYDGASAATVIEKLKAREPPVLRETRGVPRDLMSVARKAMAFARDDRYATAGELAGELRRFREGRRVQAHRYSPRELTLRWLSRRVSLVVASAGLLALVAVTAIVGGVRVLQERKRAEATTTLLLGERGRQELLGGRPVRALAYLGAAYARGERSASLRFLLGAATRALEAGEPQFQGPSPPTDLAFSPAGDVLAVASGDEVALFDVRSHGPQLTLATRPPLATLRAPAGEAGTLERLTFRDDGRLLTYAAGEGGTRAAAALWDVAGERIVERIAQPAAADRPRTLSPDGTRLLKLLPDGQAELLTSAGQHVADLGRVAGFAFNHDGTRLATSSADTSVRIWLPQSGALLDVYEGPEPADFAEYPLLLAFSRDGERLASSSETGFIVLWDLRRSALRGQAPGGSGVAAQPPRQVRSADGARVFVHRPHAIESELQDGAGRRIAALDTAGPSAVGGPRPQPELEPPQARFSPDGRLLVTTGRSLRAWRAADGQLLYQNELIHSDVGSAAQRAVRFSPDSAHFAVLGTTGWTVLRAADGERLAVIEDPGTSDAVFAPSGELLATVGTTAAHIWDWGGRRMLARFPLPEPVDGEAQGPGDGAPDSDQAPAAFDARGETLVITRLVRPAGATRPLPQTLLWDTRLETRSPAEIDGLAARHLAPWKLLNVEGGALVPGWSRSTDAWRGSGEAPRNLGLDEGELGRAVPGWMEPGPGSGYRVSVSAERPFSGRACALLEGSPLGAPFGYLIRSMHQGRPRGTGIGYLMQSLDATRYRGKRVRVSAAVRNVGTPNVRLWLRVDRANGEAGSLDSMEHRPIPPGDWQRHEVAGVIEADAQLLNFGLYLSGAGKAFLDDVRVEAQ